MFMIMCLNIMQIYKSIQLQCCIFAFCLSCQKCAVKKYNSINDKVVVILLRIFLKTPHYELNAVHWRSAHGLVLTLGSNWTVGMKIKPSLATKDVY